MGKLIVLMGPTGAGKSAQGDLLASSMHGAHLSSGKLLRRDPVTAAALHDGSLGIATEVHRVVGEAMGAVPSETPLILDGTPRTMADVVWLDENLPRFHRTLECVVMINIDIETSLKRLGKRGRGDDTPEAVRAKWKIFKEITLPVAEHYRKLGMVLDVDGRGSINEVHDEIKSALAKAAAR